MRQKEHFLITSYQDRNAMMFEALFFIAFSTEEYLDTHFNGFHYNGHGRYLWLKEANDYFFILGIIGALGICVFFYSLYMKMTRKNHIYFDFGKEGVTINLNEETSEPVFFSWNEVDNICVRYPFSVPRLIIYIKPVKKRWKKYVVSYSVWRFPFIYNLTKAIKHLSGRKDIIKKRIWENWCTKEYLERNHS